MLSVELQDADRELRSVLRIMCHVGIGSVVVVCLEVTVKMLATGCRTNIKSSCFNSKQGQ